MAALELFHEVGFNGSSVQDIVDRAGVPKGSFYNYFKAKELLALEVLETYSKGSNREVLTDKTLAPMERLRRHFESMASRYQHFGYRKGCLIGNVAAETSEEMPMIREAILKSLSKWTELIAAAIREGQGDKSISTNLPADALARFLINSWEGAVIRMKIVGSREPLDDFFAVGFLLFTRKEKP
jgi:TetR/AcrR family transcriptional repressor of nem operon